jgi:hypothetical protein
LLLWTCLAVVIAVAFSCGVALACIQHAARTSASAPIGDLARPVESAGGTEAVITKEVRGQVKAAEVVARFPGRMRKPPTQQKQYLPCTW